MLKLLATLAVLTALLIGPAPPPVMADAVWGQAVVALDNYQKPAILLDVGNNTQSYKGIHPKLIGVKNGDIIALQYILPGASPPADNPKSQKSFALNSRWSSGGGDIAKYVVNTASRASPLLATRLAIGLDYTYMSGVYAYKTMQTAWSPRRE